MESENRYSIGAVAQLTGLTPETLRAWERRYQLVAPGRDERGRAYSDADVQKLRLLKALTSKGHSIGRIASLTVGQLESLRLAIPDDPRPVGADLTVLFNALEAFDGLGVDRELGRLASLLPPREFALEVAVPFLRQVGDGWHEGRLSVAHEHLASACVRSVLGTLVRLTGASEPRMRILFATPTGERHEFGLLAGALLAAAAGVYPLYLGSDLPPEEIALAARRVSPMAVVVVATGAMAPHDVLASVRKLAELLPPSVPLWSGGARTDEFAARLVAAGALYLESFEAYEARLGLALRPQAA